MDPQNSAQVQVSQEPAYSFPANSVVEQLFGVQNLRQPQKIQVLNTQALTGNRPRAPRPKTRPSADPDRKLCPLGGALPSFRPAKVKPIRSRSQPCRKNAIWQKEQDKEIKITKKQPNFTVPSHVVPPRSKPKSRRASRSRSKPPATKPGIQNASEVKKAGSEVGITEENPAWRSLSSTTASLIARSNGTEARNKKLNSLEASCRGCAAFKDLLVETCGIISAKDGQLAALKENLILSKAYSNELQSAFQAKCEQLREHMTELELSCPKCGLSLELVSTSGAAQPHSGLEDNEENAGTDVVDLESTPTSDFRLQRNVAWLKEQRVEEELVSGGFTGKLCIQSRDYERDQFGVENKEKNEFLGKSSKTLNKMSDMNGRSRSRQRLVLRPSLKSRHRSMPAPTFRYPFEGEKNLDSEVSSGVERELRFLRIALAARQSFLKELRHRVQKAHTIFTRHHGKAAESNPMKEEDLHELLDSHKGFLNWLKQFILKGLHDIQKFDDSSIFVDNQTGMKFYFEISYNKDGKEHGGIFIPIPFNRELIEEERRKRAGQEKPETKSVQCQCEDKWNSKDEAKSAPLPQSKRIPIRIPTKDRQVQTRHVTTLEQGNQTSQLYMQKVVKLQSSSSYESSAHLSRSITSVNSNGIGTDEKIPRNPSRTNSAWNYESQLSDELAICADSGNSNKLKTIFSSTTLADDNEDEIPIALPEKKSVSFKTCTWKEDLITSTEKMQQQQSESADSGNEEPMIPPPSSCSCSKSIKIARSVSATTVSEIGVQSTIEDMEASNAKENPVRLRASVTEENIRKRIESITDMIRQFRSESFKSAGYDFGDGRNQRLTNFQENKEFAKEEIGNKPQRISSKVLPPPEESDQVFFSLTNMYSSEDTVIPVDTSESFSDADFASTRSVPSLEDVKCNDDDPESGTEGFKEVEIIFGKSFKELNHVRAQRRAGATSNSSSLSRSLTSSKSKTTVRLAFDPDSETFIETELDKIRSELMKTEAKDSESEYSIEVEAKKSRIPVLCTTGNATASNNMSRIPKKAVETETRTTLPIPISNVIQESLTTAPALAKVPENSSASASFPRTRNLSDAASTSSEAPDSGQTKYKDTEPESPRTPRTPEKSRIPVPKALPKPRAEAATTETSSPKLSRRSKSTGRSVASRSYPGTPRVPVTTPPHFYSPREPPKKSIFLGTQPPKLKTSDAHRQAGATHKYNQFGYRVNGGQGQGYVGHIPTTTPKAQNNNRLKSIPNPLAPMHRNLVESVTMTPMGPAGMFPKATPVSYFTTEYGASYNRSELSSSKRHHVLAPPPFLIPSVASKPVGPPILSRTIAANFDFK